MVALRTLDAASQPDDAAAVAAAAAALAAAHAPVRRALVASTRGDAAEVARALERCGLEAMAFTDATPVPVASDYATPATLGCDRLAAAVGATVCCPGRNVLIVDCGTAVTFDRVTADGRYCGGCISPGAAMRFRALHEQTARLPLCALPEQTAPAARTQLVGRSTAEAIVEGVVNSLTFEIEGYIARTEAELGDLCVIFTGGDAIFFEKRIKNTIFANRNLVLCGLNRILEYNASEEHLD